MIHFEVSKGVVVFLASPITPGKFVRLFCHLRLICVRHFTLPHFVLSFPMKTIIGSVQFIAAIIRPSALCIFRVTFSPLHIISIEFRPVINSEDCHPRCMFKLYGEVNSVKNTTFLLKEFYIIYYIKLF